MLHHIINTLSIYELVGKYNSFHMNKYNIVDDWLDFNLLL